MNHHAKTRRNRQELGTQSAHCSTASEKKKDKKKNLAKSLSKSSVEDRSWHTSISRNSPHEPLNCQSRRFLAGKKIFFSCSPTTPHIWHGRIFKNFLLFTYSYKQRILPSFSLPSVHHDHHPGTRKAGSELIFESNSNRDQPGTHQLWTDCTRPPREEREERKKEEKDAVN